jgi:hypothetical protein
VKLVSESLAAAMGGVPNIHVRGGVTRIGRNPASRLFRDLRGSGRFAPGTPPAKPDAHKTSFNVVVSRRKTVSKIARVEGRSL